VCADARTRLHARRQVVSAQYDTLAEEERALVRLLHAAHPHNARPPRRLIRIRFPLQLRGAVTSWLLADGAEGASEAPSLPPYLRAKLAQLFAALLAADARFGGGAWRAPLSPLLDALAARGAPAAPPLFAALEALHEDVLSLEFGAGRASRRVSTHANTHASASADKRSFTAFLRADSGPASAARSGGVKDALRADGTAAACAHAAAATLAACAASAPGVAASAVASFAPYLEWVDLGALTGPEATAADVAPGSLAAALRAAALAGTAAGDASAAPPRVRAAARRALALLAARGMPPAHKLALLARLDAIGTARALAAAADATLSAQSGQSASEADADVADAHAASEEFIASVAHEYLSVCRRFESEAAPATPAGAGSCAAGAAAADDPIFAALAPGDGGALRAARAALDALFPLAVSRLAACSEGVGDLPSRSAEFISDWLTRAQRIGTAGGIGTQQQQQQQQLRDVLLLLLRRMRHPPSDGDDADGADEDADEAVASARAELLPLLRAAARVDAPATRAFAADALRAALTPQPATTAADVEAALSLVHALGEGAPDAAAAMAPLALAAIAAAPLPHGAQRHVALALLELCVRYASALPQSALPSALGAFLDGRGIGHATCTATSARAAYLLTRFAKTTRSWLAPLAPEALAALAPALRRALTPSASSESSRSAGPDERLCAFEAAGLLLGVDEVPQDTAATCAHAVLGCIADAMQAALAAAAGGDARAAAAAGPALAQARALCVHACMFLLSF
jgi:exportin-T